MVFQWFSLQSIFSVAYFKFLIAFGISPFIYGFMMLFFFLILLLLSQLIFSSLSLLTLGLLLDPKCSYSPSFSSIFPYFLQNFNFHLFWEVGSLEIANLF